MWQSCSSRTILEKYLKHAVTLAEDHKAIDLKSIARQSQTHFHLAHYADALFRSSEERLNSNEWQAAMRLRKHKVLKHARTHAHTHTHRELMIIFNNNVSTLILQTKELEALIKQLKSSSKASPSNCLFYFLVINMSLLWVWLTFEMQQFSLYVI